MNRPSRQGYGVLATAAALAGFVLGTACGTVDDPDQFQHGCTLESTNAVWNAQSLRLHHTDARYCPLQNVAPLDWVDGGGRIVDLNFQPGYPADTWLGDLEIREFGAPYFVITTDSELFALDDWDNNGLLEWTIELMVSWQASPDYSGRDRAWFYVSVNSATQRGLAKTVVDYYSEHM